MQAYKFRYKVVVNCRSTNPLKVKGTQVISSDSLFRAEFNLVHSLNCLYSNIGLLEYRLIK